MSTISLLFPFLILAIIIPITDLFDKICEKIRNKNEIMIIRDIDSLIVFFAQTLTIYDATYLNHLYECVNENWNNVIFFHDTRSQLDCFVKFERYAFTKKQLKTFEFFVSEIEFKILIYFMITTRMYFFFFICEIKCDVAIFDVVDRQNAHSMIVVVKAFVEFFKTIKREKELNRKILIFFVSHDHRFVKTYDHYFLIERNKIIFYRHSIRTFDFIEQNDKKSEQFLNSSKKFMIIIRWSFINWFVRALMICQSISILIFFNLFLSFSLHFRVCSKQLSNLYWAKNTISRVFWRHKKLHQIHHSFKQLNHHSKNQKINELTSSDVDARKMYVFVLLNNSSNQFTFFLMTIHLF